MTNDRIHDTSQFIIFISTVFNIFKKDLKLEEMKGRGGEGKNVGKSSTLALFRKVFREHERTIHAANYYFI